MSGPTLGEPGERAGWHEALQSVLASLAAGEELAGDPLTLAGIIAGTWRRATEATIRQELGRAGQPVPETLLLSNPEVLAAIDRHATDAAVGINATLQTEATAYLAGLPDATPSTALGRLLTTWLIARSVWKLAQVAITETATAVGQAQREFIARSGATGTATLAGGDAVPLDDPRVGIPAHVGSLALWQTQYDRITTPWHGQ